MTDAAAGNVGTEARAKIRVKVRALLAMTTDNGCTEAEAMAAAQKAADLMAEYNLSFATVDEVKAERYGARKRDINCGLGRRSPHEARLLAKTIAQLFGCRAWQTDDSRMVFFGTEADTEAAHQQYVIVVMAMEVEFAAYMRTPGRRDRRRNSRGSRTDFMDAMTSRLNRRLLDICAARAKRQAPRWRPRPAVRWCASPRRGGPRLCRG